jgi:hypothetical protein
MYKSVLAFLLLFCVDALAAPPVLPGELLSTMKGPVGRYQMVRVTEKDGRGEAAVMILDTANGDLWQWVAAPNAKGGDVKVRLIYMGHVQPATKMGEVVDKGSYSQ